METVLSVYVLLEIKKAPKFEAETAVGVTTDLVEAEAHKARTPIPSGGGYVEFAYKEFPLRTDLFVMGAESTLFMKQIEQHKEVIQSAQEAIQKIIRHSREAV